MVKKGDYIDYGKVLFDDSEDITPENMLSKPHLSTQMSMIVELCNGIRELEARIKALEKK